MAAALQQPWISHLVESELKTALHSLKSYVPGQPELKKDNRYCRPGEVEIRFSKKRQVQVTEFPGGLRNPYDAVLSDGSHRIHAIFEQDAVQAFAESTLRDYLEIKGGIIIINKYYLVVNSALAPTRLALRILDFKLQGSEGSPLIGRQEDVLMHGKVDDLVGELDRLCSTPQASAQFQLSSSTSQDKTSQLSGGFATQMNYGLTGPILSPAAAQETVTTSDEVFLARLAGPSRDARAFVPKPADGLARAPALGPVPAAKIDAMKSTLENRANLRSSQAPVPLLSSNDAQDGDASKLMVRDVAPQDHLNSGLTDSEKENSLEHVRPRESSPTHPETVYPVQLESNQSIADQLQLDDAFKGLKRVPRRFVRISEEQKALLARNDCWYKPQPGNRPRYANIPPKVMDDLTEFSNRKPSKPQTDLGELTHSPFASEDESGDELAHDTSAGQPVSDHDGENLGVGQRLGYHDAEEQISKANTPPSGNQIMKGRSPWSGLKVVDLASDSEDEDRMSWSPTPEPEETSHRKLDNQTDTQLESTGPISATPNTPSAPSWRPQFKPYTRTPVNIPSSSPTKEEEMELAVPYAVGDVVDPEDVQEQHLAKASQELPSTAPPGSRYIQVKRTPYVKSRSFEEVSSRRYTTGPKRAIDDVSSDPIIPATFIDSSSSNKQNSSLTEQVPRSNTQISSTQTLPGEHAVPQTPTNVTQGVARSRNSTLRSPDESAKGQPVEKITAINDHKDAKSRLSPARHRRLSQSSRMQMLGSHRRNKAGYVSPSPELHAPELARHVEPSHGKSHARQGKDAVIVSPQTHLSKRERQMVFSDVKIGGNASEGKDFAALLLEEKFRARDAKRNFKDRERLSRQGSTTTLKAPNLPVSPHLPVDSNSRRSLTPQKGPRVFLSPTPVSSTGDDEITALASDGEFPAPIRIDPAPDQIDFEEAPAPSIEILQNSSPIRLSSSDDDDHFPAPNAVEKGMACSGPPRKVFEQTSHQESLTPSTPSSAQIQDEENNDGSPLHEAFKLDSFTGSQPPVDDDNNQLSAPEPRSEFGDFSLFESRISKIVEHAPTLPTQNLKSFPANARPLVDGQGPDSDIYQAENLATPGLESEVQEQPLARQRTQSISPPSRRPKQQNTSRSTAASTLNDPTYDNFLLTYPEYAGDKNSFTRALVCIEWLRVQRMPPWSICDDFIRAYVEYEPFLRKLVKEKKATLTAWEYYDSHVKTTVFEQRFIDDENKLATAISLLDPLRVKNLRDRYNSPSADVSRSKLSRWNFSKSVVPQVRDEPVIASSATARTTAQAREPSPELGISDIHPRPLAREPFFETPSQLPTKQRVEERETFIRSVADVERSYKKQRTFPWEKGIDEQNPVSSSPKESRHVPRRKSPSVRSAESKKRRHSDDQRRATLPPRLRPSVENSRTVTRSVNPPRSISRNSEAGQTEITYQSARASPELPDFTEKWVAQQQLPEDQAIKELKIPKVARVAQKQVFKKPLAGQRKSGFSSKTESPSSTKKKPYKDFGEVARLHAQRRRSGGLSSRASTPNSTPAKRFCTKPKAGTPV